MRAMPLLSGPKNLNQTGKVDGRRENGLGNLRQLANDLHAKIKITNVIPITA